EAAAGGSAIDGEIRAAAANAEADQQVVELVVDAERATSEAIGEVGAAEAGIALERLGAAETCAPGVPARQVDGRRLEHGREWRGLLGCVAERRRSNAGPLAVAPGERLVAEQVHEGRARQESRVLRARCALAG